MIRISFRQSMLVGFMLISLLLGAVAVRSWQLVEQFVLQSRLGGEQSLQLSRTIQELHARTIEIERNARQYRLLNDAGLLARIDANLGQSGAAVERLESLPAAGLASWPAEWRAAAVALRTGLRHGMTEEEMMPVLLRLRSLDEHLGVWSRDWMDGQNAALLARMELGERHFVRQLLAAVAGILAVALTLGWWLGRPVRRLELAIERLGESRFDQPVEVRGPDDLNRLGRRLEWLRRRLAELEANREQTLRHVSHELKTPLTALREGIALLRERVFGPLREEQREVVEILNHNVLLLQRQIESLLDLNAASHAARRRAHGPVQIRGLLAEAVDQRELQIKARGLSVILEGDDGLVRLDKEKMRVVLDNLLSNAIDYSPQGGRIRLAAERNGGQVRFDVVDEGPGVADEDAERIFQPFVRGRRAAPVPRQGSGLGLSIVRELLQAMAGSVRLVNSSRGAHFRVEVPDEQ